MPDVQVRQHHRHLESGKQVAVRRHMRHTEPPAEGPRSAVTKEIPEAENTVWQWSVQDHRAERAGRHFDLRIGDGYGDAHSWAIREFPKPGKAVFAPQTFTHTLKDMDFEGFWKGYGKGTVKLVDRGLAIVHESSNRKIRFSIVRGRDTDDYALIRIGGPMWKLVNMAVPGPPSGKPTYKAHSWDESVADDPNVVIGPKIDGGYANFLLVPGKRPRAFSPRTRADGEPIEYTHKIKGLVDKKWSGRGPTLAAGEIAAVDSRGRILPVDVTSALLNCGILECLRRQKEMKVTLKPFLFNVPVFNGERIDDEPYSDRMALANRIARRLPVFTPIPVATTPSEKRRLLRRMEARKHPMTDEGVVLWETKGPTKMKLRDPFDVVIRDVFRGREGKYKDSAGGFWYSHTPRGPVVGKVGTGFSDRLRRELWKNRDKVVGLVAKVDAEEKLKSGALRGASFKGIHSDKSFRKLFGTSER